MAWIHAMPEIITRACLNGAWPEQRSHARHVTPLPGKSLTQNVRATRARCVFVVDGWTMVIQTSKTWVRFGRVARIRPGGTPGFFEPDDDRIHKQIWRRVCSNICRPTIHCIVCVRCGGHRQQTLRRVSCNRDRNKLHKEKLRTNTCVVLLKRCNS